MTTTGIEMYRGFIIHDNRDGTYDAIAVWGEIICTGSVEECKASIDKSIDKLVSEF